MDLSEKHFTRAAAHHAKVAKCFTKAVKIAQGGMNKADADPADILSEVLDAIQEIAEEHAEMSEHCSKSAKAAGDAAMEAAEKAAKDRFSATLVPTEVRKVVPTRPGYTPVVRMGEPTPPGAAVENVPLEFQKLVSVE